MISLSALMTRKKLTANVAAEQMGITAHSLKGVLNGSSKSPKVVHAICAYFDIPKSKIFANPSGIWIAEDGETVYDTCPVKGCGLPLIVVYGKLYCANCDKYIGSATKKS